MAKFQDLPDELLLEIASQILGRHRNSDLACHSLVSRQFRPIAQEALLQAPCFKLTNIHLFMLEMRRQEWVIPKIQALELWSTDKGRTLDVWKPEDFSIGARSAFGGRGVDNLLGRVKYTGVPCPAELRSRFNMESCIDTIRRFSVKPTHQLIWLAALNVDVAQALLGLLLVSLPNLKELRCAASG
ncbi:hypothetical protein BU23DRAFT_267909 [Bimuria novae-zelandiae CBS 107.79]|uniref:Uncharacterized protein n=1 Tax=Bimuria novae-zelandiae CBS 107.79 TaxID=1447943 RepID=A0A6A5UTL6_9PLEO|nr:hypothetical protein BU23DRAFT_267909 [Bimuria novae-zelandiae CBS 107.79]